MSSGVRYLLSVIAIGVVTCLVLAGCKKQPTVGNKPESKVEAKPAAKAIELNYSIFFPPTHIQTKTAEAWAKEIEKRTNGPGQDHDLRRRRADPGAASATRAWSTASRISA